MNAQVIQRQWFDNIRENNPLPADIRDPDWLWQERLLAGKRLRQLDLPARKQEAWRYTDLGGLYGHDYYNQADPITGLDADDFDNWIYPEKESYRLVFANGRCVPAMSNIESIPEKIKIGSLRAMYSTDPGLVTRMLARASADSEDVFSTLNRAFLNDGLFVYVESGVELSLPIEVVYLNLSFERNIMSQPRSLVVLDDGARIKLVEHFTSTGRTNYFFNGVSEIYMGSQSAMQHARLVNESENAYHLGRVNISQSTASEYNGVYIASGVAWSRTDVGVNFGGEHADCQLSGVYTAGAKQYADVHLDVRHASPSCRSREDFRGIVHNRGHAVFDGRVVVEAGAQKSDAMLNNRNLILGENAEVDSKPQLEIYADDVKCGHGSTVAGIDPRQMFYLRSRGIDTETAQRMLSLGFAEQILSRIEDAKLHAYTRELLAARLNPAGSLA